MGPLFALFLRSIRGDVRARGTYIVRSALVGLILIILWITHLSQGWSGAVGRKLFSSVMSVDLIVLSVIGLSYFSSAITEEKEDETLGLLRMTNRSRVKHPAIAWKDYWYVAGGHLAAGTKLLLAGLFFFIAAFVTRKNTQGRRRGARRVRICPPPKFGNHGASGNLP